MPSFRVSLVKSFLFTALVIFSQMISAQSVSVSGIGIYQEFNEPDMVVQLESGSVDDGSTTINRLSLRMIKPKSDRRWSQFWRQNLSLNNSPDSLALNVDDLLDMLEVLKGPLEPGDLIEFESQNDSGAKMRLNSVELIQFSNAGYYDFVLSALVGPIPPSSALKSELLGQDKEDFESSLDAFSNVSYDAQRQRVIESWIAPAPQPEAPPVQVAVVSVPEEPVEITSPEIAPLVVRTPDRAVPAIETPEETVAEQERAEEARRAAAREAALEEIFAAQRHLQSVRNKVYSNLEYPRSAVRFGREGTVRIALILNRDGSIKSLELSESTDYRTLNNAAIKGVEASAPFDPAPDSASDETTVEFPITFALTE